MPTVKNLSQHVEDLHDGRPLAPYDTAEVSDEDLAREHYTLRLTDGVFLIADEPRKPRVAPKETA